MTKKDPSSLKKIFLSINRKTKIETKNLVGERDKTSPQIENTTIATLKTETPMGATTVSATSKIEPPARVADTKIPTKEQTQIIIETSIPQNPRGNEQKPGLDRKIMNEFIRKAQIMTFDPNWIPPCET